MFNFNYPMLLLEYLNSHTMNSSYSAVQGTITQQLTAGDKLILLIS